MLEHECNCCICIQFGFEVGRLQDLLNGTFGFSSEVLKSAVNRFLFEPDSRVMAIRHAARACHLTGLKEGTGVNDVLMFRELSLPPAFQLHSAYNHVTQPEGPVKIYSRNWSSKQIYIALTWCLTTSTG